MSPDPSFVSDNAAGIHPSILEAIERANRGAALGYGDDDWTEAAMGRLRAVFGPEVEALLVFNGTAANVLALRPFVDTHHAVVCARTSHLWRDECNAPERFLGAKLVPVESPDGKLTPELVRPRLHGFGDVHHAQPRAISVAQPTEWGTVYTLDELRALAELAHAHDMVLHVDGARLANAAAALDVPLGALGAGCGVDALSLGGTKLGLLGADAVLYFDPAAAARAGYYRKQAMQLASKMRFLAAQLEAMLAGDLWRELAAHANAMAARLGRGLAVIDGVERVRPVETNAVFVRLPEAAVEPLGRHAAFHLWEPGSTVARFMTAWDTEPERVDRFVDAAAEIARVARE